MPSNEAYKSYKSTVVTVGTTAVEAKCDATRDYRRRSVFIYNDSSSTIFYGPANVTTSGLTKGVPLFSNQGVALDVGDVGVFLICATAGNSIIVQELA